MKELTKNEQLVYDYLLNFNSFVSPTQVGRELDKGHSSWGSPVCLRLVEKGLVERNEKGWYKANK